MSKIKSLRELIVEQLRRVPGGTYHRIAPNNAEYPYKVYTLQRFNLSDLSRTDYDLCVDVWDRGDDPQQAENIADALADAFNAANLPSEDILPTFFRENGYPVEDPDKKLIHYQMHFSVQMYER